MGTGAAVADVGCGPGHIAAHLKALGMRSIGIDLSPGMIELARRRYSGVEFAVGSMLELPIADGCWDGIVALYSIIHLDAAERVRGFAEFHRALRAGGLLLLSFHIGDETRHVEELLGEPVSLDFHFLRNDEVCAQLEGAGFDLEISLQRRPYAAVEGPTRRGYILARSR